MNTFQLYLAGAGAVLFLGELLFVVFLCYVAKGAPKAPDKVATETQSAPSRNPESRILILNHQLTSPSTKL